MATYINSTFSLNMVDQGLVDYNLRVQTRTADEFRSQFSRDWENCLGHQACACWLSELTGISIPMNRRSVCLQPSDVCWVVQYVGPRPQEGQVFASVEEVEAYGGSFKLFSVEVL